MTKEFSIKDARLSTGLSQEDFAKEIGMKVSTYIKKEQYQRGLSAGEMIAISDFTNIPCKCIKLKSDL